MNIMYFIKSYIVIFYFSFMTFSKINVKDINTENINAILNKAFSNNKKDIIRSRNNILKIFINSKRIFEILSENGYIEDDYSVNFNTNVFVKYFKEEDLENEYIFLESNQLYYNKRDNLIIFLGNVHIKLYENDTDLYSECIIYDIDSDVFFNTHKNSLKLKDMDLEGDNLYLTRDLSKFLLENIKMSNIKF